MVPPLFRFTFGIGFLVVLLTQAQGAEDDYRQYFKPPETMVEFWNAIDFEIEVGRYDLAAKHLHNMLAKNPTNQDLVKLHQSLKGGMSDILKLRRIRDWVDENVGSDEKKAESRKINKQARQDVDTLIDKVTKAVKEFLGDPARIRLFVKNLASAPEEREYAIRELAKSGVQVVPYLLTELRQANDRDRSAILSAMPRLGPEVVPPLIAALESNDAVLQEELIELLVKRRAVEAVPYLWPLAGNPARPERVRKAATAAIDNLLGAKPGTLPSAKDALTREGERYYLHRVKFASADAVPIWRWDGMTSALTTVPATKAEEYLGSWFARQALAIDPTYEPAQVLLLSLALDKAYERVGLAKPLTETAPALHEMLTTVNPSLLVAVLDRAMDEKRTPVVLGAVGALGDVADVRATKPTRYGEPSLIKALVYPDRRVQMAAADSLMRIPGKPSPQAAARVVEVLSRALEAGNMAMGKRKVLVAVSEERLRAETGKAIQDANVEPVLVASGRDALRRLIRASDIDGIVVDSAVSDPTLPYLMAQLRADARTSKLPVLLAVIPDSANARDLLRRYQDEKLRLEELTLRSQGYRDKRTKLQNDFDLELYRLEDRLKAIHDGRSKLVKDGTFDQAKYEQMLKDQQQKIDDLKDLHEANLKELRRRFPEAAHMDTEGQQAEERLRRLSRDYEVLAAAREDVLRRSYEKFRSVQVVSANALVDGRGLMAGLRERDGEVLNPLSPEETKQNAEKAVRALDRMARGELPGYSVAPAVDAVATAIRSDKLSVDGQKAAIDFMARQDGGKAQTALANVLLDPKYKPDVRNDAGLALIRHIQKNGLMLTAGQVRGLKELHTMPNADKILKATIAQLQGSLRPDARTSGERLLQYPLPDPAAKDK
jgi:hypothetical protein